MSLINDVLRQVDSKSNAGARADIAAILPAPVTYTAKSNFAGFVFASVSSLLVFVLILQLVSERSLFSIFENNVQNIDAAISHTQFVTTDLGYEPEKLVPDSNESMLSDSLPATQSEIDKRIDNLLVDDSTDDEALAKETSPDESYNKDSSDDIPGRNQLESIRSSSEVIKLVKSKNIATQDLVDEVIAIDPVKPVAAKNQKEYVASVNDKKSNNSVTVSSKSLVAGEQDYQKSLRLFIDDNLKLSDQFVKAAIQKNDLEKYHLLQARIYIKQKDSDKFYALVKDHPGNDSLDWFKLIAPGLQLFSYYQLSNQYYYSLIKVEPDQIRWQLATALNYQRMGDKNEAIATYKKLYESDQVSNQQRQWLIKKIERLSAEKV